MRDTGFPQLARLGRKIGIKVSEDSALWIPASLTSWLLSFYPTWARKFAINHSCLISKPHLGRWVCAAPWCTITTLTRPWIMENWLMHSWTMRFGYLYPAFLIPLSFNFPNWMKTDHIQNFSGTLYITQLPMYTHWRPRFPSSHWGKLYHSKNVNVHMYVYIYICIFIHTLLIRAKISFSSASGALELFFNITILLGTDLIRVLKPAK